MKTATVWAMTLFLLERSMGQILSPLALSMAMTLFQLGHFTESTCRAAFDIVDRHPTFHTKLKIFDIYPPKDMNMASTERIYYRTKDGRADYGFEIVTLPNGTERAYITSQPSYQGRDDTSHPTHRLSEGARKYVCWDAPIYGRDAMKAVVALWSDCTQEYIKTGRRFG
jgi:hypothetical protein